jgi:hypothetical protein
MFSQFKRSSRFIFGCSDEKVFLFFRGLLLKPERFCCFFVRDEGIEGTSIFMFPVLRRISESPDSEEDDEEDEDDDVDEPPKDDDEETSLLFLLSLVDRSYSSSTSSSSLPSSFSS